MSAVPRSSATYQRLDQLVSVWDDDRAFALAVAHLHAGRGLTFDNVVGGSRALLAAALARRCPSQLLVVTAGPRQMDELAAELPLFTDASLRTFPAWEAGLAERDLADVIYGERLSLLKQLAAGHSVPRLIVTSIQSLQQPVTSPATLSARSRLIRVGDRLDVDELLRWLAENRFHGSPAVALPGEFARRGGILDIFAPGWSEPVRIEMFGDEVESMRRFNPETQRSSESVESIEIAMFESVAAEDAHFAEFLEDGAWVLLFEPEEIGQSGQQYVARQDSPERVFSLSEVFQSLAGLPTANAAAIAVATDRDTHRLAVETVEHFSGEVGRVRQEFERIAASQQVFMVAETEAEVQRLGELLEPSSVAREGRLQFALGRLSSGFQLAREGIIVLSGNDLFQRTLVKRTTARRAPSKPLDSFLDLRSGDLVVHLAHGIGRYRGMQLLDKDGRAEEHLTIEFDGGAKIYVPASRINLVQKYVGGAKTRPALAKLGGKSWIRQKEAAQRAVQDVAAEMLELQAARTARPGIAFAPDSEWQREFDASFPYDETPDQLRAIEAIKEDMESARPMDRLLCGDVGYGKTELAMRAAFKAVESGYQVAVLVPTTVLAEQHYQNFRERMAEFPLTIARLSRFASTAEQRETLKGLKAGGIDIVIGTHRLASKDVKFNNLGLVIIDEEQRFGVDVKERLKSLRSSVDVLTMTATPIPRTLHMSLVGVRDISNLETPPQDRIAVETKVTRWNNELIRHAILRELQRGGQIFFVHNRVQDIEVVARKLKFIVPEISIGIAHGQMPEEQLEEVMVGFVAHQFDLLLATTIVESGLDIPNANTIFIDEADMYGLADLHQLRGRVGRYKHRAYCYLLIDPHKHVTPNAARRLRAIEEFSEMGAGFAIAMRDLEIRGAGNLLGTEQSGHIAAVGYELYCQLLETAVRALRRLPPRLAIDVDIHLPIEAYLPDDYIGDMRLKIDLYRRLAHLANDGELEDFRRELEDRFGALPAPAEGMLELAQLRIDASLWQVSAIYLEDEYLVLQYADHSRMKTLNARIGRKLRLVDQRLAYLPLPSPIPDGPELLGIAKSVLRPA